MPDGLLSLSEVMECLELDKNGVERLVEQDRLTAYKIGGVYLRFKKSQATDLKNRLAHVPKRENKVLEHMRDFWAFNNFYIVTSLCLLFLLYITLK